MCDDPLQLVSVERTASPSYRNDSIVGRMTGRERIDPVLFPSKYTGGTGVPAAIAISSTTFKTFRSSGSVVADAKAALPEVLQPSVRARKRRDLVKASAGNQRGGAHRNCPE